MEFSIDFWIFGGIIDWFLDAFQIPFKPPYSTLISDCPDSFLIVLVVVLVVLAVVDGKRLGSLGVAFSSLGIIASEASTAWSGNAFTARFGGSGRLAFTWGTRVFSSVFMGGTILGRSWAVLGRSWAVLGGLGAVLGGLGAVLGRSWRDLGSL